jgi:hypothetical protein
MYNQQLDYEIRRLSAPSNVSLAFLSLSILSTHHSSYHHEHPAQ